MKKKGVTIRISLAIAVFAVFFSAILSAGGATNEGYGEDQTSLGQHTDSFEDSNNVSVAVDVIRNSTLEVMELNYSIDGPAYENFTTYTEVDEDGDITITSSKIDWVTMRRDAETYVWKDFSGDYFGDFELKFMVNITDLEAGDATGASIAGIMVLTNSTARVMDDLVGADWFTLLLVQEAAVDDVFRLRVSQRFGGVNVFVSPYGLSFPVNDALYITFNRSGQDCGMYIFDSYARTNLLQEYEDVGEGKTYRYFMPLSNYGRDVDPADHHTGYLENLDFGSAGYVYDPEGYFSTVDYLVNPLTSGAGLAVLVNTSIPANTDIQFQISDDNISWTDHEGVVGDSENLLGGFEAIDLRQLNYSANIYFRGNLSTTDGLATPRVYQIRLITMIGNVSAPIIQNVTGNWIEYNATAIDATVGTVDSGQLNSTYFIDGNMFNVSEVVGVPGMQISVNFTGVDPDAESLWVLFYGLYDGNLNHDFDMELWNFTAGLWVEDSHIPDMIAFDWINSTIYAVRIPNEFLNGGEVRVRLDHESAGNINHDLVIDYIRLQAFIPSAAAPAGDTFQFFWIVIGIALSLISIVLSKMWFDGRDP